MTKDRPYYMKPHLKWDIDLNQLISDVSYAYSRYHSMYEARPFSMIKVRRNKGKKRWKWMNIRKSEDDKLIFIGGLKYGLYKKIERLFFISGLEVKMHETYTAWNKDIITIFINSLEDMNRLIRLLNAIINENYKEKRELMYDREKFQKYFEDKSKNSVC